MSPSREESPTPARRAELIKEIARTEGFLLNGICLPRASEHVSALEAWLGAGRHGEMGYLAQPGAIVRRADLRRSFPEVRAVLCVADGYHATGPEGIPNDPRRGVIARYARGRDYHRVMERRLRRVHRRFQQALGIEVAARIYVDTGPVLERELAQRAGLGWFGRNTMLIHPRKGSYFFLGALLMGVDLEPDEPFARDHCGSCRACLDACPTGALLGRDASGAPIMDARLCISYLTIENRGPIPHDLRPPIGNRIFGCDICQEVCPFNESFAEDTNEPGYAARGPGERPAGVEALPEEDPSAETHPGTEAPSLVELLETALNKDAWEAFSRGSALRRAGRAGFARNVCVGLGNWRSEKAVPTLASALRDPDPLVRGHAAWALGRIGSATAREELSARQRLEGEESVRREIASALS